MLQHPPHPKAPRETPRLPRWLWALQAVTLSATLAVICLIGWPGLDAPTRDAEPEVTAQSKAPASAAGGESGVEEAGPGAETAAAAHFVSRSERIEARFDDEVAMPALQLPGRLPPLRDPRREAELRAERALQRDVARAREEAIEIGDRMARDLEHFVQGIQTLPRAEQRRYARNVHAHFDWPSADRLAVLRARLPQDERYALQSVTYKRIEPLIWRLNDLAGED